VSAFPNPAHAGSNLRLSLPSAGPARLGIYALDGSLVRTLVNGVRPAGQQTLVWDGRDDAGRALPSGVYFYRLNVAGQDSPSGKLILTR
jgi:flagellar hook assembly protein FlgD